MELRNLLFNKFSIRLGPVTLSVYFGKLPGGFLWIRKLRRIKKVKESKEFCQSVLHRCPLQDDYTRRS
jgi:hypothetical protein